MTRLKTGGREKGTPNKATASLKEAAQVHTETALATIVELLGDDSAPATRLAAAIALLDRGHGKPQPAQAKTDFETSTVAGVIHQLDAGEITAVQAARKLTSNGIECPAPLLAEVKAELRLTEPPEEELRLTPPTTPQRTMEEWAAFTEWQKEKRQAQTAIMLAEIEAEQRKGE